MRSINIVYSILFAFKKGAFYVKSGYHMQGRCPTLFYNIVNNTLTAVHTNVINFIYYIGTLIIMHAFTIPSFTTLHDAYCSFIYPPPYISYSSLFLFNDFMHLLIIKVEACRDKNNNIVPMRR